MNRKGLIGLGRLLAEIPAQNNHYSLTLFAFERGAESVPMNRVATQWQRPLMIKRKITIDKAAYFLSAGEAIVMPAKKLHAILFVLRWTVRMRPK